MVEITAVIVVFHYLIQAVTLIQAVDPRACSSVPVSALPPLNLRSIPMPIPRQANSSRRALGAVLFALTFVVACDTTASLAPNSRLWGFITLNALRTTGGEHRVAPSGVFFLGELASIPDARIKPDSCFAPIDYVPPTNNFTGVTYLDAGAALTSVMGGRTDEIPRVSQAGVTTYNLASGTTFAFQPGDSVVVTVPGATGGFPSAQIRAKTAEPLTLLQPIVASTGKPLQLRWSPANDANSALVLSLQFTPAGAGARTREIRCAFVDDGVDSISLAQHLLWAAETNANRTVVASRLRTLILNTGTGVLEFISTYSVPTPRP